MLVGEDPGSQAYVAGKHRDCAEVGIASLQRELPATATQGEVEEVAEQRAAAGHRHAFVLLLAFARRARGWAAS